MWYDNTLFNLVFIPSVSVSIFLLSVLVTK